MRTADTLTRGYTRHSNPRKFPENYVIFSMRMPGNSYTLHTSDTQTYNLLISLLLVFVCLFKSSSTYEPNRAIPQLQPPRHTRMNTRVRRMTDAYPLADI